MVVTILYIVLMLLYMVMMLLNIVGIIHYMEVILLYMVVLLLYLVVTPYRLQKKILHNCRNSYSKIIIIVLPNVASI